MAKGLAKTNAFMLGAASVLIGPQADLFDLVPANHGLGLVKNFKVSGEPAYTELTQGVKNSIVFSVLTKNTVRASMEVYEYTQKNLAYGLGLSGSDAAFGTVSGGSTTIATQADEDDTVLPVVSATGIVQGDHIMIGYGLDDRILVRKVASVSSNNITIDKALPVDVPVGSTVKKVTKVGVGSKVEQPFLSAMVLGSLANGEEVAIAIPKLRVSKGFDMDFRTDNYGNLPFEFTVYDLVETDPFYSDFAGDQARVFSRA